ncbi:hypothetical protein AC17_4202 [Escherichia coli 2-210-07_S3_C2]|nr:hypothetical protein AC17_4202 [Escherichia coli 2-210-07_S3_C2]
MQFNFLYYYYHTKKKISIRNFLTNFFEFIFIKNVSYFPYIQIGISS